MGWRMPGQANTISKRRTYVCICVSFFTHVALVILGEFGGSRERRVEKNLSVLLNKDEIDTFSLGEKE